MRLSKRTLEELRKMINGDNTDDKWEVVRDNDMISFKRHDKVIVDSLKKSAADDAEDVFLSKTFTVDISRLGLIPSINDIITKRLKEAEYCIKTGASLSAVIMIGSSLEGILLGIASLYPQIFNQAQCAPKDINGKVRKFHEWKLNNLIDTAFEIGFLKQDVKKFSRVVYDFRNYIHPYQQMNENFDPDNKTVLICLQVVKAAISQIADYRMQQQGER